MSHSTGLVDQVTGFCQRELQRLANPDDAAAMAAYMKTEMPFYGVKKPQRIKIVRSVKNRFEISDIDTYTRVIEALWVLPNREEKYIAIQIAQCYPKLVTLESMELYERLVREGAWWDLVDDVAIRLVGKVLLDERIQVRAVTDCWIGDEDRWIRRAAIISQIKHKESTDHCRLFSYCKRCSHETDFFIRKGIGWALREYSKSDPDRVLEFMIRNRDRLSALSYREGGRLLRKLGYDL